LKAQEGQLKVNHIVSVFRSKPFGKLLKVNEKIKPQITDQLIQVYTSSVSFDVSKETEENRMSGLSGFVRLHKSLLSITEHTEIKKLLGTRKDSILIDESSHFDTEQQQEREKEQQVQNFGILPQDPPVQTWIRNAKKINYWNLDDLHRVHHMSMFHKMDDLRLPFEGNSLMIKSDYPGNIYFSSNHTVLETENNGRLRPLECILELKGDNTVIVLSLAEAASVRMLAFTNPGTINDVHPFRLIMANNRGIIYDHGHGYDLNSNQSKHLGHKVPISVERSIQLLRFFSATHHLTDSEIDFILDATRDKMTYADRRHLFSVSKRMRRKDELPGKETEPGSSISKLFKEE